MYKGNYLTLSKKEPNSVTLKCTGVDVTAVQRTMEESLLVVYERATIMKAELELVIERLELDMDIERRINEVQV